MYDDHGNTDSSPSSDWTRDLLSTPDYLTGVMQENGRMEPEYESGGGREGGKESNDGKSIEVLYFIFFDTVIRLII